MTDFITQWKQEQARAEERAVKNLKAILTTARSVGVTNINVTFSGYGDSGQVDDVTIEPDHLRETPVIVESESKSWNNETKKWDHETEQVEQTLCDAVEQYVYDRAEATGVDWYNNDGGYGEFNLNVETGVFEFDISQNYTSSNHVFGDEGVIEL